MNNAEQQAKAWEDDTNMKLFRTDSSSVEELDAEWNKYCSVMSPSKMMKSDDESIRIYGHTNSERYSMARKKLLDASTATTESAEDSTDEERENAADAWEVSSNLRIFRARGKYKEDLEQEWREYEAFMSPDQQRISDDASIRIFGVSNVDRFNAAYNKAEKKPVETNDGDYINDDSVEEYRKMQVDSLNALQTSVEEDNPAEILIGYKAVLESCDPTTEVINTLSEASNKIQSLVEYTPMAAMNPVIGAGPLPAFRFKAPVDKDEVENPVINNKVAKIIMQKNYNSVWVSAFSGAFVKDINKVQHEWVTDIATLQDEYHKTNSEEVRQCIKDLGWHPDYDIREITDWSKLNENTLKNVAEEYGYANTTMVNLCEFIDLIDGMIGDKEILSGDHIKNMNPVYIVLSGRKDNTIGGRLIRWYTVGPYSHAAIGMSYKLDMLYSFNSVGEDHTGFSIESLDFYKPDDYIYVFCLFVNDDDYKILHNNINYFKNNKARTNYSPANILSIVFKKPLNYEFDMICSQFVDRVLKFISVDLTKKDSSLVSPNDLWRSSANKRVYTLYSGYINNYKPEKIKKAMQLLIHRPRTKLFKEAIEIMQERMYNTKLLLNKNTSTPASYATIYGKHKIRNPGQGMISSTNFNDAIAKHSIENSLDDIETYKNFLEIQDPQELVLEYNKWISGEFAKTNEFLSARTKDDVDKIVAKRTNNKDKDLTGVNYALCIRADMLEMAKKGISFKQAMDIILTDYFEQTDDPDKIHRMLRMRVNYANRMLNIFKRIIRVNSDLLEIAKDKADVLVDMIDSDDVEKQCEAIVTIKKQIEANPDKWFVNTGVYDFSKLDSKAGVVCISPELKDDKLFSLSRLIQLSFQWDVVVAAHGNSHPNIDGIDKYRKSLTTILDDNQRKYKNFIGDYEDKLINGVQESMPLFVNATDPAKEDLRCIKDFFKDYFGLEYEKNKYTIGEDYPTEFEDNIYKTLKKEAPMSVNDINTVLDRATHAELKKMEQLVRNNYRSETPSTQYEDILDAMIDDFGYNIILNIIKLNALDRYLVDCSNWIWTTQPVYTTKAGPFTSVNELLRQLIFKEGFKRILLFNCNPGRKDLPDDIKNANVVIKYGTTYNLGEASDISNPELEDTYNKILDFEYDLYKVCEANGIDYNDDAYLEECAKSFEEDIIVLTEKAADLSWDTVKQYATRCIAAIVDATKKVIDFFKRVINNIRLFFVKLSASASKKFVKPLKVKTIRIDNSGKATLTETSVNNYNELEQLSYTTCSEVVSNLDKVRASSMSKITKISSYVNTKVDKTHHTAESAVTEMSSAERNALPDKSFGIPDERKFPLNDEEHVRSAIKLFGHCPESKRAVLARRIQKAAKKFNVEIKDGNLVAQYLSKAVAEEYIMNIEAETTNSKSEDDIFMENMFISKDNIEMNLNEWQPKPGKNILYVTGLSGSGKTAVTSKIGKERHAEIISFDSVSSLQIRGKVVHNMHDHPLVQEYATTHELAKAYRWNDAAIVSEAIRFNDWICTRVAEPDYANKLIILEGCQVFSCLNPDDIKGKPLIITGTSTIVSIMRKINRGRSETDNKFLHGIKHFFRMPIHLKHYNIADKLLSNFFKAVNAPDEGDHFYLYHLVPKGADVSKGLTSLAWQYENDHDAFLKNSNKYKGRIVGGWGVLKGIKPMDLTDEQILSSLDAYRKATNSANRIYFFKYPPHVKLGPNMAKILAGKDIYRIDLNDKNTLKYIESIDYGYVGSSSDNDKLDREYYENITPEEYFSNYSDDDAPIFSNLYHISVTPKDMYIPRSCLVKISNPADITESCDDYVVWNDGLAISESNTIDKKTLDDIKYIDLALSDKDLRQLGYDEGKKEVEKKANAYKTVRWGYYKVEYVDGKPVGYVYGTRHDEKGGINTLNVSIAVLPEYRGKGIAEKLAKGLCAHAKNDKLVDRIVWATKKGNDSSYNLAKKLGFQDDGGNKTYNWQIMNIRGKALTEAKEFPVQFDDDGNLLIKNFKKMDFNQEYQKSHSMLKTYAKTKAIDAMKYELARLWFINIVLSAKLYDDMKALTDEQAQEYAKVRAWVMNDFVTYNKIVSEEDPTFNFSIYYESTPFSDANIKIRASTLKNLIGLIKSLFAHKK